MALYKESAQEAAFYLGPKDFLESALVQDSIEFRAQFRVVRTIGHTVFTAGHEYRIFPDSKIPACLSAFSAEDVKLEEIVQVGELCQAEVVVTAGNGIQEWENLKMISDLADIFPRSAVAGTRIVCDRGWLPYSRQIGATGTTVFPKLYIGCGVSGAIQHLAGMMESETIVAINTDPHAALMNAADILVNTDLIEFIPELIEVWKNEKNQHIKKNSE